jgi:hypothetical protein
MKKHLARQKSKQMLLIDQEFLTRVPQWIRIFKGMDALFSTGRFGLGDFERVRMDCWTKNGANLRESKKTVRFRRTVQRCSIILKQQSPND